MLNDAFKLTVDKLFNSAFDFNQDYNIPGYGSEENLWEKIGEF